MRLAELVETSGRVAGTGGRLEKIGLLAACLGRVAPEALPVAVAFLSGRLRQGRIGVGPTLVAEARSQAPAPRASLTLADVDAALARTAAARGPGAAGQRRQQVRELLGRATRPEQDFLARLLVGELRQGALEALVLEALARAREVPVEDVRRAVTLEGDLGAVARALAAEGRAGLARFALELFRPVRPMLAGAAADVADALGRLGRAALEWKLDGARVQVHKGGRDVRVFSRRLRDVTAAVPEIVARVETLPARELVLDGEVLALRPEGGPEPFQVTMRRFGRKRGVARLRAELPLHAYFFDCLYRDGASLLERPAAERFAALDEVLPDGLGVPRTITDVPGTAATFLAEALRQGHEGVMAKSLVAPYAAGARGGVWLKLKPAHTLDLVVLAAEWGHGRRRGWLSNLHLGARGGLPGEFVMVGKTFKGLTDAMLREQTRRLLALEVARDAHTVHVRPELVVEVAVGGVQANGGA